MSIRAEYTDVCEACEGAIRAGEWIDRDPFTEHWMHTECPQDKSREVCPDCFTQRAMNGTCSC